MHFGHVAGRALRGARKDDVVHAGGAHALVGAFAHHPAQRFEQVGLAAAIGADDAGQSRFDDELGRLDERLEARKPQPRRTSCAPTQSVPTAAKRREPAQASSGSMIFLEFLDRRLRPSAISPLMKKVGIPIDPELVRGLVAHRHDALGDLLVLEAGIEAFLGEAGKLRDLEQFVERRLQPGVLLSRRSMSISGKYFSLGAQRASMKAASPASLCGNSRKTKRILPVSI